MYCTKCGIELRDQDRFCPQCGMVTARQRADSPQATRRLTRSMHDKKIAGVCSGFAHYLDLDVVLVRIVWLTLAFASGLGVVGYIIAWVVMPGDNEYYAVPTAQPSASPTPAA